MTVPTVSEPSLPWIEQIDRAELDLLRSMMKMFVQSIMAAEADAICGAGYGARNEDERGQVTRLVAAVQLQMPRLARDTVDNTCCW